MAEILRLTPDSSFEDVSAAAWSVVRQDVTELSEEERARVLEECHEALGFDPSSGVVDTVWGQRRVGGEKIDFLHPYIKVPGLRALTNRFGGAATSIVDETVDGDTLKVTVVAEMPSGRTVRARGSATEAQAVAAHRLQVEVATEQAVRRALWGLVRTSFTDQPAPGGLAWAAPAPSTAAAPGEALPTDSAAVPAAPDVPRDWEPPTTSRDPSEPVLEASRTPDVDPELASFEPMAPSAADLAAVESTQILPPEWCLPTRDDPTRRLPWPMGLGRVTAVGQMPPSEDQMREYQRLLAERGVEGNAIFKFTGRLHTHAETPLNPALLTASEMARCIDQVRELASEMEMKGLYQSLSDRGYLEPAQVAEKLTVLVGAKAERDLDFVTSRTVGQAIRALETEPTLVQVHECRILLERIGVSDPTNQATRLAEITGRDEPTPPEQLSAKEIAGVIATMRPTVARMKLKKRPFPTNRQRLFPWSSDLK